MKHNPLLRCSRALRICAVPFAAFVAVSATAANISWNGAADAVWSTGGNWVGGLAPVATDVAVFNAGSNANLTTALGADFSIQGLRITTPGGLITIGAGNLLTLGAGGIDMSAASQNLLLNALVALAADQSWNVANGRTLTANGIISGTNVNLNKIGLGDLILGGANTFTGATTISGGTLTLNGSLNGTTGTDLTFAGTGTFNVSASSGVSQGMKVLRFSAGDGTVRSTHNGGTSTVSFTSRAARVAGATGNFTLINGTQGAGGTNNITIGGELTAQLLDRGLFYNGSQYAAYDAGGFVRGLIYGADADAPASVPSGATLGVNDATQNVEISGDITAQTTASVNTIRVPGAFNIALDVSQTLSLNGILKSGGSAATISGGTGITTTAANNEMVIRTDGAGDSLAVSTPIIANGTSSLTKSGEGTLIFSAANSYAGVTSVNTGVLQIGAGGTSGSLGSGNVNNSANLVFNRSDSFTVSNLISGNGSLTKNGAGTLTLAGANSFKGSISILSGVLSVSESNNFGDNSATDSLFINSTGTLRDTGVATSGRNVSIVNGSTIDVTTAARLTVTGNFTTNVAAGDVNLNKTGPGTLNINGGTMFTAGNTPNRTIHMREGALNFTNATVHLSSLITQFSNAYITATNSTLDFNDTGWFHGCFILGHGNNFYSAAINGGSIKTEGLGIYLNLGGNTGRALMTLDGGVTVDASEFLIANNDNCIGVLNIRNAAITNAYDITLGGSKAAGYVNQLGGTINNAGTVNLAYRMGQANNWGIYNLKSGTLKTESITSGDGSAGYNGNRAYFNFHGGTLSPRADSNNFAFSTLTGANAGSVSAPQMFVYSEGAIIDTDGKSIVINEKLMAPAGQGLSDTTIVMSGANQGSGYRGEPLIRIGDTTNLTASVIANMVDDGTGNGTFKIASLTVINPGVNYTAAPALTIFGGDPTTAATLPATLPIAPNVSGGLTKVGLGTLTLSAANTYTGVTTISGGTLQIGNGGTTGSINTTSNVINNGVLAFNRTDNYGGDFTRVISGSGSVKVAGGVLTLLGTNTYTGSTILSGGTLSVGSNANFGDGGALNFDGGTLQVTGTALSNFDSHAPSFNDGKTVGIDVNNVANTFTVTQVLNQGAGGLTKLGAGKLLITGNNTYTGATTVSGGVLQIGDGGSGASISASSGIVLSNNSDVIFDNADDANFGQSISGAGNLVKAGTGTLKLSGANSYTGTTLVNAGILEVNGTLSGSTEVNSGGTLAGSNGTLGNVTVESSGAFSPGSNENPIGSLTVNGDLELQASSNFNVQFDTDGGFVDAITVSGNLTIVTGAVFNVNDIGSTPDGFLNFPNDIITYSGTWNGGTFLGMQDDSIFTSEGVAYLISYNDNDINDLGLHAVTLTIVPEPGAAVSLLGGLGILLGLRRRRV